MSRTPWEYRKGISDRVFGVFDAQRSNNPNDWPEVFERARIATLERLEAECEVVRCMTFDEFSRLQRLPAPTPAT